MWPGCAVMYLTVCWTTHTVWSVYHRSIWTLSTSPLVFGHAFIASQFGRRLETSDDVIPFKRAPSVRVRSTRRTSDELATAGGDAKVVRLPQQIGGYSADR